MSKAPLLALLALFTLCHCTKPSAPPPGTATYGLTEGNSVSPASWLVPAWFIDPANTTGCASDTNSGTSATCAASGVGPLLTFQQLNVARWGCFGNPVACPRLRQNTVITLLSSQPGTTDPIDLFWQQESGSYVELVGALGSAQSTCTGILANVTPKNRATPQLLQASVTGGDGGACTLVAGQLIVNSLHSSRAWTYANVSGNTWKISQPLAPVSIPFSSYAPAEVDTWTNGDPVTVYTPVSAYVVAASPMATDDNSSFNAKTFLYQLNISDPNSTGFDSLTIGLNTVLAESSSQRALDVRQGPPTVNNGGAVNTYLASGMTGGSVNHIPQFGAPQQTDWFISGGVFNPIGFEARILGANLDADVILAGPATISIGAGQMGFVYIETSKTLDFIDGIDAVTGPYGNETKFWGPGGLALTYTARLNYTAGASQAAATFANSGGITLNSQSLGCVAKPSSSTITCNTSITAANLDTNLGATAGCIGPLSGASICNYGP
jgi:hypothetical protein